MAPSNSSCAGTRHLSLLMSTILSLYCAGCTDGGALSADDTPQGIAESGNITRVEPAASDSAPPAVRTPSNHTASATTLGHPRSTLEHLQVESIFILNEGISSQAAEDLLHSSRTASDAIDRMTRDAASSPDAQDLTKHYRSALTRAIGPSGVLDGFSCGLSICIGIARSRGSSDHEGWEHRLASDPSSPTYSYAEASEGIDGGYETRFIFSTDPALNSISGN